MRTIIKEAVHCPAKYDAHVLLNFAHKEGYKWCNDKPYIDLNGNFKDNYYFYRSETCYCLEQGTYCSKNYFEDSGYKIITVDEFINKKTKNTMNLKENNWYIHGSPKLKDYFISKKVISLDGNYSTYSYYKDEYNNWQHTECITMEGKKEITFEDLIKYEEKCYVITPEQATTLINMIVDGCLWKVRLANLWGVDIALHHNILVPYDLVAEGYKDASDSQKDIMNIIFPNKEVDLRQYKKELSSDSNVFFQDTKSPFEMCLTGKYKYKGLYLNESLFNFEIVTDNNLTVLLITRK